MLRFMTIFCLLITLFSCSRALEREAHRSQALLDESELLLDARYADRAKENAADALETLEALLLKDPGRTEWRLLRIRAHLMLFFSTNFLIIDNAPIQSKSLVRLPAPQDYIGYQEHIVPAETEIKEIVNSGRDLNTEESGFLHGNLAAIYRLSFKTLEQSDQEYEKAVSGYDRKLRELKSEKKKVGSNDLSILQLENQIRAMRLAQSEVALLAQDWNRALNLLREAMAGEDLKFFTTQFEGLEREIASLENKITSATPADGYSREQRVLEAIRLKKEQRLSKRSELGGKNPYEVQLAQAKIMLADAQNNLIYRIICYHNQNQSGRLEEARQVLRTFYPDLDSKLQNLLNKHS